MPTSNEERSTIVGAIARPVEGTDAYELVVVLDEPLGGPRASTTPP